MKSSTTNIRALIAMLSGDFKSVPQEIRDKVTLGDICAYDLVPGAVVSHWETAIAFVIGRDGEGKAVALDLVNGQSAGESVDPLAVGPTKEFVGRLFSDHVIVDLLGTLLEVREGLGE